MEGRMQPLPEQLHAGRNKDGKPIWHMWVIDGDYFSGKWGNRTPRELLNECRTTIADLLKNHPELED